MAPLPASPLPATPSSPAPSPDITYAPGVRVVIRDAEWIIRRVDRAADGGQQLVCDGVSELVREREAIFLTALEPEIRVLDPANTRLVRDDSPGFADSLLYLESQLRQAVPGDDEIHVGHKAAMDHVPYQFHPARQALRQPRQRLLIADGVGLGKTLEAGILVSELIARGRGRRILVLAVKSMLTQFQKEFWNRFTIPLTRLDSIGIQRVRSRIPTNHNPFHYYDKAIISIDTLKRDTEYRTYLENARWDIIVIDEAHNVADRGGGSQRSRLARLLARRSDTLIMLSATPHDGRARSFASLVNMLDATAIADPEHYTREDFRGKGLVIRRFKKDINHQVRDAFRDREVVRRKFSASPAEEAAYEALLAVRVAGTRKPNAPTPAGGNRATPPRRDLFLVTLEKALFSSPAACRHTIANRLNRRRKQNDGAPDPAITAEVESLATLDRAVARIENDGDYPKYQALLETIRERPFQWNPNDPDDRLVIFTERIETLRWLQQQLSRDLKLRMGQLDVLHGSLSDVDQQRIVEEFGNRKSPVRLLICSDVASEGINLHYTCHRLIHFDIPWSLMVFAQRNGRVDRYGQKRTPTIVYLMGESANPTILGDARILEVLAAKDDQAYRNIGDPSAFMNVRDINEEEEITRKAIAAGEREHDFDARLQPARSEGDDLLALFLGNGAGNAGLQTGTASAASGNSAPPTALTAPTTTHPRPHPPTLYPNDLTYCAAALHRLRARTTALPGHFETDHDSSTLTLDAPDDLRHRFRHLPREIAPDKWRFVLTTDRNRMETAITDSRRDETAWPALHYLWRLHPVVGWLNDRMLALFGRHEAPVLAGVPGLAPDESVFLCSGLVPNRKGHPLVYEWTGVAYRAGAFDRTLPFADLLDRTGLGRKDLPNRQLPVDETTLRDLLPDAVARARREIRQRRDAFEEETDAKLNREYDALKELETRQYAQIEEMLAESRQPEAVKQHLATRRRQEVKKVFNEYLDWIQDTMTTEKQPWIQVASVLTGDAT